VVRRHEAGVGGINDLGQIVGTYADGEEASHGFLLRSERRR
jgi:hypothetical protein